MNKSKFLLLLLLLVSIFATAQQNINLAFTSLSGPAGAFNDVAEQNSSTFYGATSIGLYKSTNAGTSWTLLSGLEGKGIVSVEADANNIIALVIDASGSTNYQYTAVYTVYRSTNGGTSFTEGFNFNASYNQYGGGCYPSISPLFKKADGQFYLNRDYSCNNYGYSNTGYTTHYTNDGGATWNVKTCGVQSSYNTPAVDTCDYIYQYMAFKGDSIISVRNNRVTVSPNNGVSNSTVSMPDLFTSKTAPAYINGRFWAVSVDQQKLIRGTNFANFTSYQPTGINSESIKSIATKGNTLYLLTGNALYKATDANGTAFTVVYDSNENDLSSMSITNNAIWLSEFDGENRYSANDGSSWSIKNIGLANGLVAGMFNINGTLFVRQQDINVDLRKFNTANNTWTDFTDSSFYNKPGLDIKNFNNTLYAIFNNGVDSMLVSTNAGATWSKKPYIMYNLVQDGNRVYGNTYPDNSNVAKTFYSDNNGSTWTQLNGGNGDLIFAQGSKLYRRDGTTNSGSTSLNGGATWTAWAAYPTGIAGYADYPKVTSNGRIVVLYIYSGITIVSSNNGVTWQQTGSGIAGVGPTSIYSGNDYPYVQVVDSLLFLNFGGPATAGLYISKNYGATWGYAGKSNFTKIVKVGTTLYGTRSSLGLWKTELPALLSALNFSDLTLTQTAPSNVAKGVPFNIKLELKNTGNSNATSVSVKDKLPPLLTFNSATPSTGTYSASTGIWTVGSVNANITRTLTLNVTATDTSFNGVKNFAQIWAASPVESDNIPGNDTDNTPTEDDESLAIIGVAPASVDLSMTQVISNSSPNNGDTITVTLKVANAIAFLNATGVQAKFNKMAGLVFISSTPSQGIYNSTTGIWNIGNVNAGTEKTLVIKLKATVVDNNIVQGYTGEVSACTQLDYDSTPNDGFGDDAIGNSIYISVSNLYLDMTADINADSVIYTLTLLKDGTATLNSLSVKDKLPAGLNYVSHSMLGTGTYVPSTGIWTITSTNLFTNTLTIVAKKTGAVNQITNFAQVWTASPASAIANSQPGNNSGTTPNEDDEDKVSHGLLSPQADMALEITATTFQTTYNTTPATQIDYQVIVYNNSNNYADNVKVKFNPPAGAILGYNGATYNEATNIISVGDVAENTYSVIYVSFYVLQSPITSTQKAFAQIQSLFPLSDPNSTPGNDNNQTVNEDDEAEWIIYGDDEATDLTCNLSIPNPNITSGSPIFYTVNTVNGPGICNLSTTRVFISTSTSLADQIGWLDSGVPPLTAGETFSYETELDLGSTEPGTYYLIAAADHYADINETNESNNFSTAYQIKILPAVEQQTDLNVTLTSNVSTIPAYTNVTFTCKVSNTSNIAATNVSVKFPIPTGYAFTSSTQDGNYNNWNGDWVIGNIAAGQSKTLTLVLFSLNTTATKFFAQVKTASPNDSDSTPNNDTNQTANEDDEALVTINGGGSNPCSADVTKPVIANCPANISLTTTGTSAVATWPTITATDNCSTPTVTGTAASGASFNIGTTSVTYTATDAASNTASCNFSVTVTQNSSNNLPDLVVNTLAAPSSGAQGAVVNFTFKLNNIGNATATANYNIKTYLSTDNAWSANDVEAGVVPTGNTPVNYNFTVPAAITVPVSLAVGNYFLIVVADNANVITESNENNNTVSQAFAVTSGGSSTGMDLNLTMTSNVASTAAYSNYTLTIKVNNTGNTAATNVKVNMTYNASNAPFTSSNVTQGSYDNFNKVWTVGSVAAGANATLTLTLFTLATAPIPHFAQVQTASPSDTDSTPGNDTNQTANEDDEASFTLNATAATAGLIQSPDAVQLVPIIIEKAYPNPTAAWLNMTISSLEEGEVLARIYDVRGSLQQQNTLWLDKGRNETGIDMSELSSGFYIINIVATNGKVVTVTVMKE